MRHDHEINQKTIFFCFEYHGKWNNLQVSLAEGKGEREAVPDCRNSHRHSPCHYMIQVAPMLVRCPGKSGCKPPPRHRGPQTALPASALFPWPISMLCLLKLLHCSCMNLGVFDLPVLNPSCFRGSAKGCHSFFA